MDKKAKSPKMQRAGIKAYYKRFHNIVQGKSLEDVTDIMALSADIQRLEHQWEYECDDESIICKEIGPTPWRSFCRFGDRKQASDAMVLTWIREKGEPLDVQAMWITGDYGKEFTPSQLAAFMIEYDKGCAFFPYLRQIVELKKAFKDNTGCNWTPKLHDYLLEQFGDCQLRA